MAVGVGRVFIRLQTAFLFIQGVDDFPVPTKLKVTAAVKSELEARLRCRTLPANE
jgi:hypothetical protein